ncbi:MAG: peptide MFS transporter, partial [Ignavibacteria bacterium]|nr:peptide MFS transporter [Ignavibacteria bacterium]
MFRGHPRGLYVLFFTEMWERFGFYTTISVFVYYLGENFGWDAAQVTNVYGIFVAFVYFTPILGGWIADNFLGYGKSIIVGAIILGAGYVIMAIPTETPTLVYVAIATVCLGNGLFKANISVLVGNLYAHSQGSLKDAGYNIFYMGINIGAFYAPIAAAGIRRFFMDNYDVTLAQGYNAAFGVAAAGMLMSLFIFTIFRKYYAEADYRSKDRVNVNVDLQLSKEQEKERVIALLIVFAIVIFFWMSFHQNGAALSLFARDYTHNLVGKFTYALFDVVALHSILAILLGSAAAFSKSSIKIRGIGGFFVLLGLAVLIYKVNTFPELNTIAPEQFQSFNPMFIVLITPLIISYFAALNRKGKEPSSPGKIGIGMLLTGLSFLIMVIASTGLPAVHTIEGTSPITISPFWLISTYFVITIAELHLSPMGLSFVSKVAPAKMKGLLMGGWFGATAAGNYLSGFVGRFYQN